MNKYLKDIDVSEGYYIRIPKKQFWEAWNGSSKDPETLVDMPSVAKALKCPHNKSHIQLVSACRKGIEHFVNLQCLDCGALLGGLWPEGE